jgi:excisionase family DNA binding protein
VETIPSYGVSTMPTPDPISDRITGPRTRTITTVVVEPVPEFESMKTAAARTEISVWTFRDLIASGKLRAYRLSDKPGSAIRVKRADVDALFRPVIPDAIYADRAARR